MSSDALISLAPTKRHERGGGFLLRRALRWSMYLFAFVMLGLSIRPGVRIYKDLSSTLHSVATTVTTVDYALAVAGMDDSLPAVPSLVLEVF